jgi:hypothetical protein
MVFHRPATVLLLLQSSDVTGHRVSVGGSLVSVSVPTAASTRVFDANNRLTTLNGVAVRYDADGNTLTDGSNTYTWDARNQLSSLTGAPSDSFTYDGFGV